MIFFSTIYSQQFFVNVVITLLCFIEIIPLTFGVKRKYETEFHSIHWIILIAFLSFLLLNNDFWKYCEGTFLRTYSKNFWHFIFFTIIVAQFVCLFLFFLKFKNEQQKRNIRNKVYNLSLILKFIIIFIQFYNQINLLSIAKQFQFLPQNRLKNKDIGDRYNELQQRYAKQFKDMEESNIQAPIQVAIQN